MRRVLLAFEPPDGGVAENVAQLALGLGDQGWEVELAAPRESILDERAAAAGIPIHRLAWARGYGHPGHDYRSARQLARCLRRKRFDLLHCHSAKAGVIGRLVGRAAHVPGRLQSASASRSSASSAEFVGSSPRRLNARWRHSESGSSACASTSVSKPGGSESPSAVSPSSGTVAHPAPLWSPGRQGDTQVCGRRPARCLDRGPAQAEAARRADRRGAVDPRACAGREGGGDRRWAAPWRTHRARRAPGVWMPSRALHSCRSPRPRLISPRRTSSGRLSSWEALAIGLLEALACGIPTVATDVGGSSEVVLP